MRIKLISANPNPENSTSHYLQKLGNVPKFLDVVMNDDKTTDFRKYNAVILIANTTNANQNDELIDNTSRYLKELSRFTTEGTPIFVISYHENPKLHKTLEDTLGNKLHVINPENTSENEKLILNIINAVKQLQEYAAPASATASSPNEDTQKNREGYVHAVSRIKNALLVRNPESKGIKEMIEIVNSDSSAYDKLIELQEKAKERLEKTHMVKEKDSVKKSKLPFFDKITEKITDKFKKVRNPDNQALYEALKNMDTLHPDIVELEQLKKVGHDYSQDKKNSPGKKK